MFKLKGDYLRLINKKRRNIWEKGLYFILFSFSFLYLAGVKIRNFCYDKKIFKVYEVDKKIINVGNLTWGGTGKTTMAVYLHGLLSESRRAAVIAKRYANDEYLLLKEKTGNVIDVKDRVGFLRKDSDLEAAIIDDGFQYRKLKSDINIVMVNAFSVLGKQRLIPAGGFREPLRSLERADIVVFNHITPPNENRCKEIVRKINPAVKVFFSYYRVKRFLSLDGDKIDLDYLNGKLAALTAIGYPQGFFRVLEETGVKLERKIIYPDHFFFSRDEMRRIENDLIRENVAGVIITLKDFYHIDFTGARLNYFIADADLEIKDKDKFDAVVNGLLSFSNHN